ncbi:MAG: hypothetical protein ACP5RH_07660 [Leptodesmis sp.]|uniref:hypothetical protein n=1 Tax=Leptodesmis sp. TaxID=3100501 RepID=UPI003D0BFCBB
MTPDEISAALQAAFHQCEMAAMPLTAQQQKILWQALGIIDQDGQGTLANPLTQLSAAERQALLQFIRHQAQESLDWKATLLNDWLQNRDSGPVQFIRDRYGLQWLEQVQPFHLAAYENPEDDETLRLQVGDRIEITNGLWEWVQESGPCSREWFPCTVVSVQEGDARLEDTHRHARCVVRFESGAEYEIQGIYEWNRPNWRWLRS